MNCVYSMGSIGLDGKPVKRTKQNYPYNYDTFIVWKSDKYLPDNKNKTVYSDRLHQWDWKKYNKCCTEIWGNESQYFDDREPEEIERFLSIYLNKKLTLLYITEGCNQSNGFPLWSFVYKEVE